MSEVSSIQWFPGHMAKTRRLMQKNITLVDAVVEITDARIPYSSRNPEMDRLVGQKPRLIILNKCDAADENITAMWLDYYKKKGVLALATDCRSGKGVQKFLPLLKELLKEKIERWNNKGMVGRPIRIMIVGIPNVGKSSFINKMAKSKMAKVEDRPGVTRGKQWVSLGKELELLDMPGVLWPKFEDKLVFYVSVSLFLFCFFKLFLQICFKFINSVELSCVLNEIIINLRKLLCLDFVQLNLEYIV